MENQHRKIKGYTELTQKEIDLMNRVKEVGVTLQSLIDDLEVTGSIDQRWLEIAKTDLQKGLMSLTRSVARPDFF